MGGCTVLLAWDNPERKLSKKTPRVLSNEAELWAKMSAILGPEWLKGYRSLSEARECCIVVLQLRNLLVIFRLADAEFPSFVF